MSRIFKTPVFACIGKARTQSVYKHAEAKYNSLSPYYLFQIYTQLTFGSDDQFDFPEVLKRIRRVSRCTPIKEHLLVRAAERNDDIMVVTSTYELLFDKYFVLCVYIVVPVQEFCPRQRSR